MEQKIIKGDCYELIKTIPDKSVDLIITDPPYDIVGGGACGGKNEIATRMKNRYNELCVKGLDKGMDFELLKEFERVCKKVSMYIWCNKTLMFDLIAYYHDREDINMDVLVWGKTNPMPLCNNHFLNDCEYCLYIREKGVKWNEEATYEVKKKFYTEQVNKEDKKNFKHPTIKPLKIIKNFVINSSRGGALILDPFVGSGTTAVACKELGRNFIGFELNEEYYKIAVDRLNGINVKGQTDLFNTNYDQLELL